MWFPPAALAFHTKEWYMAGFPTILRTDRIRTYTIDGGRRGWRELRGAYLNVVCCR
jgi:hypothetical protein